MHSRSSYALPIVLSMKVKYAFPRRRLKQNPIMNSHFYNTSNNNISDNKRVDMKK